MCVSGGARGGAQGVRAANLTSQCTTALVFFSDAAKCTALVLRKKKEQVIDHLQL